MTVNDGKTNSTAATVTVTAAVANVAPIANAGAAQNVVTGTLLSLDGSASSDANGDILTYAWTLTSKPAGSTASLTGATTAKPFFTAGAAGTYVATLVVNDGKVYSAAATTTVTATVANAAPVANPGITQNVVTGNTVVLDGSASSDANGDPLTYVWMLSSRPAGSTAILTAATSAKPSLTADLDGTYVATLVVNDGKVDSAKAATSITASTPRLIGVGYTARNGMTVTLLSFVATNLGNGYTRYSASYKEQNNTATAINQATLNIYFSNAAAMTQYGMFGKVLPGASFATTRSYSFDAINSSIPTVLEYDADNFFATSPVVGSLQWMFPIR